MFGCENGSFDDTDTPQKEPISFGDIKSRVVSSASDINAFKVWSCVASTTDGAAQSYLTNEEVSRNGRNWDYTNTRSWINNKHFYFLGLYADYQGERQNLAFTEMPYNMSGSDYMVYFLDVQTPATADLDILTAFNYTDTSKDDFSRTVSMNFVHLMTKVKFKIQQDFDKTPDFDFYVKKVTLTGIKNSAVYGVFPLAALSDGIYYIPIWEGLEGSDSFTQTYDTPVRLRNPNSANKVVTLDVWENGLLLIPQPLNGTAKIQISYYYDINLEDNDMGEEKSLELELPSTDDLWQSGKVIAYTLKISNSTDIKISTPTIEPWGSPQTGGTIIIK